MPRDTRRAAGSWIEGPAFQRTEPRGSRLGLPAEGPGSIASFGTRMVAFLVDGIVANLLAGLPYLFGVHYGQGVRGYVVYAAFLLQEFVLDSVAGATIGKQMFGIRVVRLDGGRVAWSWVLARTVLLGFLVPPLIWDRDGRGLHDRASGAMTIRVARRSAAAASQAAPGAQTPTPRAPDAPAVTNQDSGTSPEASAVRKAGATPKPPVRRRKKRR